MLRRNRTAVAAVAAAVAGVTGLVAVTATRPDPARSSLSLNPGGSVRVSCTGTGSTLTYAKVNGVTGVATCTAPTTTSSTSTTLPIPTTAPPVTTVPSTSSTSLPASTTSTTRPPAGAMPTPANTGPTTEPTASVSASTAAAGRGVSGKIVTGGLSADVGLGETWAFSDCVIKGSLTIFVDGGSPSYPVSSYPTISITRCRVEGSFVFVGAAKVTMDDVYVTRGAGMIAPCGDCAGTTYGLVREMPWNVRDSLFVSPPGTPPEHTEGMHVAGTGQGYAFTNTRFVQEGPENGTQTGALFFHGGRSTFDGCYFDDGDQGISNSHYYTVYVYGTGPGAGANVVKNSAIERGKASYVYPNTPADPVIHAAYVNNRDFHTGAPLVLP